MISVAAALLLSQVALAPTQSPAQDSVRALIREAESELHSAASAGDNVRVGPAFTELQRVAGRLQEDLAPLDWGELQTSQSTLRRLADQGDVLGMWQAAVRADSLGGRIPTWRVLALREIARVISPLEALAFADSIGELPGAAPLVLTTFDAAESADEILRWLSSNLPNDTVRHETTIAVLRHIAWLDPDDAVRRAANLTPADRARVGVAALQSIAPSLVDSVARSVEDVIDGLPPGDLRNGLRAELRNGCARRQLPFCMPPEAPPYWTLNRIGRDTWDAVLEAHRALAARVPTDSLRYLEARALVSAFTRCVWRSCDLPRFDSLFLAWTPAIESAEVQAEGSAGDDLRRQIAKLWAARDPARAADFARKIGDPQQRFGAAQDIYQAARPLAPITAAEIYLELSPPDAAMGPDSYHLFMRLGRFDEAHEVLARIEPNGRLGARLRRAEVLHRAGRWSEARDVAATAVSEWEPQPESFAMSGMTGLLLRQAGLVDGYLAKVRAAPDALTRAIGLTALAMGLVESLPASSRDRPRF